MGRVGRCQGQANAYSVGLAKEGLSFSFLDSWRPCSLVLKATGDSGLLHGGGPSIRPSCNVSMNEKGVSPRAVNQHRKLTTQQRPILTSDLAKQHPCGDGW